MSPPTRTLEPDAARTKAARALKSETAPQRSGGRPDHVILRSLQRSAGNRAVSSLVGARSVQRAPDDHPKDTSAAAFGQTVAGGPTPAEAPASKAALPADLSDTLAGTGTPPPSPAGGFAKNAPLRGHAVPVSDAEVTAAYAKDPSKVIRSPHDHWHVQMYYLDKGTGGIPMAFRVGDQIAVHPDHPGPATPLPQYAATAGVGLGQGTATKTDEPVTSVEPRGSRPGSTTVGTAPPSAPVGGGARPVRRAERPSNWNTARPVTDDEAAAAYRTNPASVIRSPNHQWHEGMYDLDRGEGDDYPRAFQVGHQIAVSPDYKGPATELPHYSAEGDVGLGSKPGPGGPGGSPPASGGGAGGAAGHAPATTGAAGPATPTATAGQAPKNQAAETVTLPGTTYEDKTRGRRYSATVTEGSDGRTQTRDRKRELGIVRRGEETSDGELTHRKERVHGAGFGVDGNIVGGTMGKSETTRVGEGESSLSTTKASNAGVGLTTDGKIKLGGGRSKEFVYGTTPAGDPAKKSSATNADMTFDAHSIGVNAGQSFTGPSGRQTNVGVGVTADDKGNASASATAGTTSKGGHGVAVTASAGHTVTAEDPEEVSPGVWEVRYVVSDSEAVGVGVTGKGPGMLGFGASGSVTKADLKTGSRRFTDEKEAVKFKDDAADRIVKDGSLGFVPVTTVVGALTIPIGEARGVGTSHGKAGGVSATLGATIGKSGHTTSSDEVSVRRVGPATVHVTATVSAEEGSDWSISGLLTDAKGASESTLFAVTYEFDLANPEGAQAFERFAKSQLPPVVGAKRVSVRTLATQEGHDKVGLLGANSAWTGTTWQDKVQDDKGEHDKRGGKQSLDQDPGTFGKLLGDKEVHSNAQIVRSEENGEDAGARAEFKVSGESGAFNRAEFGKIFEGAKFGGDATASGVWTLSSEVPMASIRALEEVHPGLRNATSMDEKMRIYSELVKEGGARMLGGQVGMTSKSWDLELKGDENFPGERGRARLKQLRKTLMAGLKATPDSALDILRQSSEELEHLQKRRKAVADLKKYTDLPDGLRKQQLALIDRHIDEFQTVRRTAQAVGMQRHPGEKGSDAATRLAQGRYDLELKKEDREYAKLQDQVEVAEKAIGKASVQVHDWSKALGDAIGVKGAAVKLGVDAKVREIQIGMAKAWIAMAKNADAQQAALDPKIAQLRDAWTTAKDPKDGLVAFRDLAPVLDEKLKLMRQTIFAIEQAGRAIFPVTSHAAMAGNPDFWQSLGMVEEERQPAAAGTSMRL